MLRRGVPSLLDASCVKVLSFHSLLLFSDKPVSRHLSNQFIVPFFGRRNTVFIAAYLHTTFWLWR